MKIDLNALVPITNTMLLKHFDEIKDGLVVTGKGRWERAEDYLTAERWVYVLNTPIKEMQYDPDTDKTSNQIEISKVELFKRGDEWCSVRGEMDFSIVLVEGY